MSAPLRCGLVGCGRVAERYYLPAFDRTADARLVAVADPSPERREIAAGRAPECAAFETVEELARHDRVDAVVITSPPEAHLAAVLHAIEAGKPVLVEKPLAPSAEGIDELASRARKNNALVQVGFNRRFWPPAIRLKTALASRTASTPVTAQLRMISDNGKWDAVSGGAEPLSDLGSHQLDLLRYLFGAELESVSASQTSPAAFRIRARLVDGSVAECRVAYEQGHEESIAVQLEGRRFLLSALSERVRPGAGWERSAHDGVSRVLRRLTGRGPSLLTTFDRQLANFARCALRGSAPSPGIEDGIRAVRAVNAARESADNDGKEIAVQ